MGEVIKTTDMTGPSDDGFLVYHEVRRDDGETVTVEAHCTGTAEKVALRASNREAGAYIADRGRRAAAESAEKAQSPKIRGKVIVQLRVDPLDGSITSSYDYKKPL